MKLGVFVKYYWEMWLKHAILLVHLINMRLSKCLFTFRLQFIVIYQLWHLCTTTQRIQFSRAQTGYVLINSILQQCSKFQSFQYVGHHIFRFSILYTVWCMSVLESLCPISTPIRQTKQGVRTNHAKINLYCLKCNSCLSCDRICFLEYHIRKFKK